MVAMTIRGADMLPDPHVASVASVADDAAPHAESMTPADAAALARAVAALEHPGFAARLANMLGKPVELLGAALPPYASQAIATATSKGLDAALKVALRTLRARPHPQS